MTLVEALLPEWDREMGLTRAMLARLPADRLEWRPHPRSRSIGQLASHLADLPGWAVATIDLPAQELEAPARPEPESVQAVLLRFDGNAAAGRAALSGKTDAELRAPWTLRANGQALFTMPKVAALRNFVFNHQVHHRGQLSVYLRLCNVPLPSLYGPSADA